MKKVVFITGASRGIWLATVKKFASNGWKVAGFYNQKEGEKIEGVTWYKLEISEYKSIKESFQKAFDDLGRIDAFVNCAGIFGYKNLAEYHEELMNKVIAVNEKGMYFTTKVILENMTEGTIIYLSSTTAQVGSSDPVYAGTKAAVLGFTKSMAKALAPKIRVNAVSPGATNTDMMKHHNPDRLKQLIEMSLLKRLGEPEDVANAIYFLGSNESINITGACIDVNGGYVLR